LRQGVPGLDYPAEVKVKIDISIYQLLILYLKNSHHANTGVLGYPDSEYEQINRKKSIYRSMYRYIDDLSIFDFKFEKFCIKIS